MDADGIRSQRLGGGSASSRCSARRPRRRARRSSAYRGRPRRCARARAVRRRPCAGWRPHPPASGTSRRRSSHRRCRRRGRRHRPRAQRAPRRRAARRRAWPPPPSPPKAGSRDSPLPPITWRRKAARMAARADSGAMTPICGSTLSASTIGRPVAREQRAASSRASTLPATTTGTAWSPWPPMATLARRAALCSKHICVAAVGAADQEHHVGPGRAHRGDVGRRQLTGGDVDDLGPGREPDPVTGLGGDRALVADDGEAQPPPALEQACTAAPSGTSSARAARGSRRGCRRVAACRSSPSRRCPAPCRRRRAARPW